MSTTEMSETLKPVRSKLTRLIGIIAILMVGIASAVWYRVRQPSLHKYEPVIAMLMSHQLNGDAYGHVNLAPVFPGLTAHDMAYITWRPDGTLAAMFPTYFGEGSEVAGLLYTSRPLQDDDTHTRDTSAIHFDQRLILVGDYGNLLLDDRINEHWYHVSFHLH